MVQYTDSEFNKDFTNHYTLLFQLEEQQYTYAIYDKRKGKLHVLKTVPYNSGNHADGFERLRLSLTSEDLLQSAYQEVKVSWVSAPFTLVPRAIFEEDKASDYLKVAAHLRADEETQVNQIKGVFIKNVFAIPKQIRSYMQDLFASPKWFHAGSSLLELAMRNRDQFADQQLILDIKTGLITILYFEKKEFLFMNQYKYVNREDFLYFVLLVADQFSIDRETCDLKLSGEIVPDAQLYDELYKFFRNITFLQPNEHIVMPEPLAEKPMYMYNTLLSLDLCE